MPVNSRQSTESRQAEIIATVVALAADRNPAEVTTTDIAKAMNVTQGALFRHFPNKEAIRLAVIEWIETQLMSRLGDAQVSAIARKLIDAVSAPCRNGATTLSVSPSVGIALYPQDGLSFETLLHSADAAMYHAKRQRLGHAFHSTMPGMAALPLIAPPQRPGAVTP